MLLGKRPRLLMKRTTSMTGISVDLADVDSGDPSGDLQFANSQNTMIMGLISPRNPRNYQSSCDIVQSPTDHFLRTCGLCRRRLATGRDIYMYRGDTAFCSLECREKQIEEDEGREEYGAVGKKKDDRHAPSSTAAGARQSRKSQTVAAS